MFHRKKFQPFFKILLRLTVVLNVFSVSQNPEQSKQTAAAAPESKNTVNSPKKDVSSTPMEVDNRKDPPALKIPAGTATSAGSKPSATAAKSNDAVSSTKATEQENA